MVKTYKYERICDLDGCSKKFKTNYRQKKFCEPAHHDEYWRRIRSGKNEVEKELSRLREKIEALEERKEINKGGGNKAEKKEPNGQR